MASLFHKSVVLCESDSDCKIYSIIESHIKQRAGKYSETLFIHCGGKHRMAKIIAALHSLNIGSMLITDIDVLNDETVFKRIIESCGGDYGRIQTDYNTIISNLHSSKERVNRRVTKSAIDLVIDSNDSMDLTSRELREIRDIISTISKWEGLKRSGTAALPPGDATSSFKQMDGLLRSYGIFIVPVGELECFIKEVGGHGPEWANAVLEKYPNLDDDVYRPITDFIESMNL